MRQSHEVSFFAADFREHTEYNTARLWGRILSCAPVGNRRNWRATSLPHKPVSHRNATTAAARAVYLLTSTQTRKLA
jgi:hypothetical protein